MRILLGDAEGEGRGWDSLGAGPAPVDAGMGFKPVESGPKPKSLESWLLKTVCARAMMLLSRS